MADAAAEERVTHLEGRVDGFDRRFDSLERRFDSLEARLDHKVEELERRLDVQREELSTRLDAHAVRMGVLGERLDDLGVEMRTLRIEIGGRLERHFQWTTGISVALWARPCSVSSA